MLETCKIYQNVYMSIQIFKRGISLASILHESLRQWLQTCLEQTINRSQKGTSGIIGNTQKKTFVVQWEIIYHEMLAVNNLHKYLSGVNLTCDKFSFNHEFNLTYTNTTERKLENMLNYVLSHEKSNPYFSHY